MSISTEIGNNQPNFGARMMGAGSDASGVRLIAPMLAVAALLAGASWALIASSNPVFVAAVVVTMVACVIAQVKPLVGFCVYLVSIQVVDLFKRALLLFGEPTQTEWLGMVLLPDILLFSVVVRVVVLALGAKKPLLSRKFLTVHWLVLAYAAWYTIRTVWTQAATVNAAGKWKLVVPYLFCFYIGAFLLANLERLRPVIKTLAWTVAITAAYGWFQAIFGLNSFEDKWLFGGYTSLSVHTLLYPGGVRIFSTYSDPGTFAIVLAALSTLLMYSRDVYGKTYWNSRAWIGFLLLGILPPIVRAGWVLAALGFSAYIFKQAIRTWGGRFLLFLLMAGTLWFAVEDALRRVTEPSNPMVERALTTGTYDSRLTGFRNLFSLGIIFSVTGNGVATLPGSVKDITGTAPVGEFIAHDYLTQSLYEVGWLGFSMIVAVVVVTLRPPYNQSLGSLGLGFRFLIFALPLLAIGVGSVMDLRPVSTIFWIGVGAVCAADSPERVRAAEAIRGAFGVRRSNPGPQPAVQQPVAGKLS